MRTSGFVASLLLVASAAIAIFTWLHASDDSGLAAVPIRSYEELTGSIFTALPKDLLRAPKPRELRIPHFPDATSVWGATGRDPRGHIWMGVSANSTGMSAHLMEYDPDADAWHDRGAVIDELKALGRDRDGEGQIKIHSKIIAGDDGRLYFASTDEEGESSDGGVLPRWGGHLWRIDPGTQRWEHLAAVPEGLVAINGVGRYVYALGYWNHVLYQYDTATQALRRGVVGSVGGHVSRNFLVDARGHAYVPRVRARPAGGWFAELVEYDTDLRELAASALGFYLGKGAPDANHGIVGLAYLADGRLLFTTNVGQLYLIEPKATEPAVVTAIGWFHPAGESYAPSLFSLDGGSLVGGVARRGDRFEWVVYELGARFSRAHPLDTLGLERVLLYGSITRDNAGRAYLVGWASDGAGGQRPLALQIGTAN